MKRERNAKKQAEKKPGAKTPSPKKVDGEAAALAKIGEMPEPDRAMGERLHAIIKACAPGLTPPT